MILTPAAIGTFFRLNYDATFGVVGYLTHLLTGRNIDYLGTEGWAFAALMAVDVWMWTPLHGTDNPCRSWLGSGRRA